MSSAMWTIPEEFDADFDSDNGGPDGYEASGVFVPPNVPLLTSARSGIFSNIMARAALWSSRIQFRMRNQRQQYALLEELEEPQNATSSTGEAQVEPSSTPGTSSRISSSLSAFFERFSFQDRIKRTKSAQISIICPDIPRNFSIKTQAKAEIYFMKFNSNTLQPSLPVEKLVRKMRNIYYYSRSESKKDVLNCIKWKLLCGYNSFHELPDNRLYTTAELFGGFISNHIVRGVQLELFLSIMLEELAAPIESKKNDFGIIALYHCEFLIHCFPHYCQLVAQIPHFNEFPLHLIECIEAGIQKKQPPYLFKDYGLSPKECALRGRRWRVKIIAPPSEIQATIRRIFRNLSLGNLTYRCDELREVLRKDYWLWLCVYLVIQRVSKLAGCHMVYSKFLDVLNIPDFNGTLIKETLRNVEMLLTKNLGDSTLRMKLHNLGHWLGMLTVGKCRPLPEDDIDLRALIVDARNRGERILMYVIPFVIKILESCATSKVFKPPNPWTISIMSVLRELYDEPNQFMKIRTPIEHLCSKLNIQITDVKSMGYLEQRKWKHVYNECRFYRDPDTGELYV